MTIKRIAKHLLMTHWQVNQAVPRPTLIAIEKAIKASHSAPVGEIRFAVEGALHSVGLGHPDVLRLTGHQHVTHVAAVLRHAPRRDDHALAPDIRGLVGHGGAGHPPDDGKPLCELTHSLRTIRIIPIHREFIKYHRVNVRAGPELTFDDFKSVVIDDVNICVLGQMAQSLLLSPV